MLQAKFQSNHSIVCAEVFNGSYQRKERDNFRRTYESLVPFGGTNCASRSNRKILPVLFGFRSDLSYLTFP